MFSNTNTGGGGIVIICWLVDCMEKSRRESEKKNETRKLIEKIFSNVGKLTLTCHDMNLTCECL